MLSISLALSVSRGDHIPRHTIEAYGDIAELLYNAHGEKAFRRVEVDNLLFQELDILREQTRATHVRTMLTLKYLVLDALGTAYHDSTYRLGVEGLKVARALRSGQEPLPTKKGGQKRL